MAARLVAEANLVLQDGNGHRNERHELQEEEGATWRDVRVLPEGLPQVGSTRLKGTRAAKTRQSRINRVEGFFSSGASRTRSRGRDFVVEPQACNFCRLANFTRRRQTRENLSCHRRALAPICIFMG